MSLHDPDARPIRKGRLGKPVEFGYKAQVVDNEDGVVIDHNVEVGNPPDAPMLVPAVERVTHRAGRVPKRSLLTAAMARPPSVNSSASSGSALSSSHQGQTECVTARRRESAAVPAPGEVENGKRRADQLPQTGLRMEPDTDRRDRRSPHLVWLWGLQPQPGEDRRTDEHQPVIGIKESSHRRWFDPESDRLITTAGLVLTQVGFFRGK